MHGQATPGLRDTQRPFKSREKEKVNTSYYISVPAEIIENDSTPDTEVNEGTTVSLKCNATGYPEPIISWSVRAANEPANSTRVQGKLRADNSILQYRVSQEQTPLY